jgi:Sorting nexin C terminal
MDMMKLVQDAIWPNGALRKNPTIRTTKEKSKTKRDAGYKLATIFEGLLLLVGVLTVRFCGKCHGPCECADRSRSPGLVVSE